MKPVDVHGQFFLGKGFKLRYDLEGPLDFEVQRLTLVTCFQFGNSEPIKIGRLKGFVEQRAVVPLFGQGHGEALVAVQQKIPTEWRQFIILLPATAWRGKNGESYMPQMLYVQSDEAWKIGLIAFSDYIRPSGRFSNYRLIDFLH